ncbi:MAG: Preprotein translocase subunit SecD [Candidatus Alkanophagales archaeon MCA70_species_1]|nr:Preprotein translocase subunit SecD [Candidatus Alkanophaga volatiphilum]
MVGERGSLLRDVRVSVFVIFVLLSLFVIYVYPPPPMGAGINGNLKYGLDLVGGSYLQLKLEGVLVKVEAEKSEIIKHEIQELLREKGASVEVVAENETATVLETAAPLTKEELEALNIGVVSVETSLENATEENVTRITVTADEKYVVTRYLENALGADVEPAVYRGTEVYEIRKLVSKEELEGVLAAVNASIGRDERGMEFFVEGVTPETRDLAKEIMETKLNMLGLRDIPIRTVGTDIILIDLAGVDIATARKLVGKPGKFEIRIQTAGEAGEIKKGMRLEEIKNITAHVLYGDEGIASVGAIPQQRRTDDVERWGAPFTLTREGAAALRDACIKYKAVEEEERERHELAMLLDDVVIYSAPLSPDLANELKAHPVYNLIAETGSGEEGRQAAKELIIHLKAGALPVPVEIIGSGEVPAPLGEKFRHEAALAAALAFVLVALVVYVRYRNGRVVLPMLMTLVCEVIIILGFAAATGWQLDLPSVAGIIAVIGTGVDQLVIITDEILSGAATMQSAQKASQKKGKTPVKVYLRRVAEAFNIIFASAATTAVAMLALALMALGTLRGFAIITIVGILIGVLITRPAYARIVQEIA